MVTVAAVQAAPILMNRDATITKAVGLIHEAARQGAKLIVFPEVYIPGTPVWFDSNRIWDDDEQWYALLVDQAVVVPSASTDVLADAAREVEATVVIGINEREAHGATIYNALLYLGPDGEVLTKHRKLVPTGAERTVWGMGDGSTLDVVQTPIGRVGGLICWENYMPLARFAMYAQGVDVWVAPTLSTGDGWIATMQHIAREARCYVIGVNPCTHVDQIPADFPMRDRIWNAERDGVWVEDGNSVIVDPDGVILAGPAREQETILYADIDIANVHAARRLVDPTGHYNRPDVFHLSVDTRPRPAVTFGVD
jgi:nitrilase